jgi:abortive infection bacteriophage resistance protein
MPKIPFQKPPLELAEFIPLLRARGLIVRDEERLRHNLTVIGYYRLSGYMFPFQKTESGINTHMFEEDTDDEKITQHYVFDRKLRLHTMDAVERIEIALRAAIVSRMSNLDKDPFWHLKSKYFIDKAQHRIFLTRLRNEVRDSPELFLRHYSGKYEGKYPPAWMSFELLSFGMLSRVLHNMRELDQKVIAGDFGLQPRQFKSWMHSLAHVRNLCAHHARLWNRSFVFNPSLGPFEGEFYPAPCRTHDISSFYVRAAMMQVLLRRIAPGSGWGKTLNLLLDNHPLVKPENMGFPNRWIEQRLWRRDD